MKINVLLPYPNAEKYYEKWATEEEKIDFLTDAQRAERCTVSFAASELVSYLERLGHTAFVSDAAMPDAVNVSIRTLGKESEEFDIVKADNGIEIIGEGRCGALYGAYELLEAQGVRWYSPELDFVPSGREFVYPEFRHYKYALKEGRGFHFEDLQNESKKLVLWMARNRMNTHASFPHLRSFEQKVGMVFAGGGHIFEKILAPTNIAEDGRPFLDSHRDWYGKRESGEITVANALKTQFCVSNKELSDYLSSVVIERMNNEWKNEDIVSLDGFDTWGKTCNCDACRRLGNGSDVMLKFISDVRKNMDEAISRGELRKNVRLSFCAYDGTSTLLPPENPVPENLIRAGDYVLYCPIMRCYEHDFEYPCDRNREYNECFIGWIKTGMNVAFLEYYNVSRFEDLPLVFTKRIINDTRYYIKSGLKALVYMHAYAKEWGVRALNNYIYAAVSRDPDCDAEALVNEYYGNVYGKYADRARKIYEKIENASALSASFRAWNFHAALTAFQEWDGMSKTELDIDTHIGGKMVEYAKRDAELFREALSEMREIRRAELSKIAPEAFAVTQSAVNPQELEKMKSGAAFLDKLNEDIRGLKYGADVYRLTYLFTEYYDAVMNDNSTDEIFSEISRLADDMCEYTYSVVFNSYNPEFEVRDALRRSQFKTLYYRIVAGRNERNKG